MTSIMAPWPFYQWGMDILGPLLQAAGRVKFVIVTIDYFTKWIEAKPLARITGKEMNTVMAHPQADSLVEMENKSQMEGIKSRLERERADWVDELPNILWAHRTSIKQSNGETPCSLTYESEAVIPSELGFKSKEMSQSAQHQKVKVRRDEPEGSALKANNVPPQDRSSIWLSSIERVHEEDIPKTAFRDAVMDIL
ncbi:reverse transcriptase domain-containing protein [Tanacetum coccineum]|uniref:Reverse transcriptase domain-containing protein n=1 Tax=Tanacetum coccineum TaxID=301880 RepID=A0ABQ5D8F9_9ASTR